MVALAFRFGEHLGEAPAYPRDQAGGSVEIGTHLRLVRNLAVQLVPLGSDGHQIDVHSRFYDSTHCHVRSPSRTSLDRRQPFEDSRPALAPWECGLTFDPGAGVTPVKMRAMWAGVLLALTLTAGQPRAEPALTLELRVFNGVEEVTPQTRIAVHRAGDRGRPLVLVEAGHTTLTADVPPGIYDVQAIRLKEGRVVAIRWAERLVVMAYPDESGHHLEVINFQTGFGALEVRRRDQAEPDVEVYAPGDHSSPAGTARPAAGSVLFVLPSGTYDLLTRQAGAPVWHAGLEVPVDRTRFWVVPDSPAAVRRASGPRSAAPGTAPGR